MPWYLILKSLLDYLKEDDVADIVGMGVPEGNVTLGGKTALYGARVSETENDVYRGGSGTVTIELGMFLTYTGANMAEGYKALSDFEAAVQTSLEAWASQDEPVEDLDAIQTIIVGSGGNNFCERPILGSFVDIQVNWSKRTL